MYVHEVWYARAVYGAAGMGVCFLEAMIEFLAHIERRHQTIELYCRLVDIPILPHHHTGKH